MLWESLVPTFWIGLSVTLRNTFNHLAFQIYQTVILPTHSHISSLPVSICGFGCIMVFHNMPCLIERASATSSYSYNIAWPFTTAPMCISLEDILLFIVLRFFPYFHRKITSPQVMLSNEQAPLDTYKGDTCCQYSPLFLPFFSTH